MPVLKTKEALAKLGRSFKLAAKKPSPKKRKKRMPIMTGTGSLVPYSANSSTTTGSQIWTLWSNSYGTTSATANQIIWTAWTGGTTTSAANITAANSTGSINSSTWGSWNVQYGNQQQVRVATAEEQARMVADRQRANDAYHARQMALQAETSAAQARALRLLRENLDAKQKADLDANGYFELETISKGGERRKYRIHRKWSGNIQQVDGNGNRIKTLCIHPREHTPVEDSMLAQKLMLEGGAEEDLLRIANHS